MILRCNLKNEDIAYLIPEAEREMERKGVGLKDRLWFRYFLEELLLNYRDFLGEDTGIELLLKRKREEYQTAIVISGDSMNPLDREGNRDSILERLLRGGRRNPAWTYEHGKNIVRISIPLYNTLTQSLKFTWKYTRPQFGFFVLGVGSQLISVVLRVIAPILVALIIENFTDNNFHQLVLMAGALFAVNIVTDFVNFVSNRAYNVVYNKTLSLLETDLVDSALHITSQCMEERGSGLFIQRLTTDTSQLATGFNTMADLISETFQYVGILVAILIISPPVFALVFTLVAVQTVIELIRTTKMNVDDRIYRNANERYTGFVGEMVRGAVDIKLFHGENTFKKELQARIEDANDKRMYMQGRSWTFKLIRQWIGNLGYLILTILLGFMLSRSMLGIAKAIVLFNYYTTLGSPFALLIGQLLEFSKNFGLSTERVHALAESPEFPKETFGPVHMDRMEGEICFDHVRFSYKNHAHSRPVYVLSDMNFVIHPGESVALVGRSGSGKSTVFHLISKLYTADSGLVTLDGVDICSLDSESIRANMAVVPQHPYIFNLSIRDNLRLVKPDMTEEEMVSSCKKACIDEEIRKLPEGYDTMIGEGGTNLSGGQLQRLAIARAFLRDCRMLLFDEATSALDNITQARISDVVDHTRDDRTVIIIAHRLSTVMNVDRILYLEGGRVLAEGRHEDLIRECRPYRELFEKELRSGKNRDT